MYADWTIAQSMTVIAGVFVLAFAAAWCLGAFRRGGVCQSDWTEDETPGKWSRHHAHPCKQQAEHGR